MTRRLKLSFHYCLRLKHSSAISVVLAGSLGPGLLRIHKTRQCACLDGELGTPGAFWEGKEQCQGSQKCSYLLTCDSDLKHVSPCRQQET